MRLNRTQNAFKNTVWGIVYKFLILLFPFIIRTVMIKQLGIEYLGLNSLFASILSMLNMTELGVGTAIVYSMYKPIAENNFDTLRALMALYKKIYRIIGIVVLIIGCCLIPFLPKLISGDVPTDINIYILYGITLSNTVITYLMFAYRTCLLNAYQRVDIISKVAIVTHVSMYVLQLLVIINLHNYYVYILISPCISAITNVLNAIITKKMYPELYCRGKISSELKADIKKRVTGLMMTKIAFMSRNSFDSIVVSAMLGLTTVAMYNNYYYILSSVSGVMVIFMTSISAGIGNSIAMDTPQKNEKDMLAINTIYMLLSFLAFSCFISAYQPFMRLWVGSDYVFESIIMLAFSIYFLVEKTLNVIGQYYDAAGLWWEGKWKGFIEAIANLVLNVVLCKFLGVFGIVSATIITILTIGLPLTAYYVYKCYYKKSAKKYLFQQYSQLAIMIIIGLIVYYATRLIPFGSDLITVICYILLRIIVGVLISASLITLLLYKTQEFQNAKGWLIAHIKMFR